MICWRLLASAQSEGHRWIRIPPRPPRDSSLAQLGVAHWVQIALISTGEASRRKPNERARSLRVRFKTESSTSVTRRHRLHTRNWPE